MSELLNILPGYLTFIIMTVFLVGGSARLIGRFFPEESRPYRVLLILVLSLLAGHLIILVLGACHILIRPVLLAAAVIYGVTGWLTGRRAGPVLADLKSLTWFEALVAVLVVGYFAWFGVTGLLNPPGGVDDLEYHLPYTAQVLQRGDLNPFFTPYTGPIYYPQTIEIGYLWWVMPLKNDFLINLGNLPFLFLLALAARQLLREWGVSRNWAALAMPLLLYAKIVSKQAWVAHVDVPLAALFVTACLFLVRFARIGKGRELVLLGGAAGLLLGSKYSAVGYTALILAAFFVLELRLAGDLKKSFILTAVVGYIIAMAGGYYYVRNFFLTGTPLYPAGIKLPGFTIFPSGSYFFIEDMSQATLIHTFLTRPWGTLDRLSNGLVTGVMFWTAIALPVSLLAPFARSQRKRPDRPPVPFTVYLLAGLTFLTLVLYLNTPYAGAWSDESKLDVIYRGVRHGISCWTLALVGALYWFDRRWPWPDGPLLRFPPPVVAARTVAALVLALIIAVPLLHPNRHRHYYDRMDHSVKRWVEAWKWLDQHAPPGSRIAFTQMYLPYYDFGRSFQNTPRHVSVNRINADNYHDYEGSGLRTIHAEPDYSSWLHNLKADRIDFIHWGNRPKDQTDTIELQWMKDHPEQFQPVLDQPRSKVFRFIRPADVD